MPHGRWSKGKVTSLKATSNGNETAGHYTKHQPHPTHAAHQPHFRHMDQQDMAKEQVCTIRPVM